MSDLPGIWPGSALISTTLCPLDVLGMIFFLNQIDFASTGRRLPRCLVGSNAEHIDYMEDGSIVDFIYFLIEKSQLLIIQ